MNIEKIEINGHHVWVDKDAEINQDDWVYSTDNTTSSLNIYQINNYIKDQEHPIGFGGKCYLTKQGVGIRIETCKKIIAASPELNLEGVPTYYDWLQTKYYFELEQRREIAKNFTGQVAGRHPDMFGHNEVHHMVRGYLEGYQTAEKELYTEEEVERLLITQRGNCYVAILSATKDQKLAELASKAPEPWSWRK